MAGVVDADARDHALRRSGEARFDRPPPLRSVDDLKAYPARVAQK